MLSDVTSTKIRTDCLLHTDPLCLRQAMSTRLEQLAGGVPDADTGLNQPSGLDQSSPTKRTAASAAYIGGWHGSGEALQDDRSSSTAAMPGAASREKQLLSALETAEGAVALLQGKLVEALRSQTLAEQRLADTTASAKRAGVRADAALAAARAEGTVRLRSLEEAVARLGGRSEAAGQVSVVL